MLIEIAILIMPKINICAGCDLWSLRERTLQHMDVGRSPETGQRRRWACLRRRGGNDGAGARQTVPNAGRRVCRNWREVTFTVAISHTSVVQALMQIQRH